MTKIRRQISNSLLYGKVVALLLVFGINLIAHADNGIAPTFHFNFKDAAGKREIQDQTGKFKCISEYHDFVVQQDALRIAPVAKIFIPTEKLPDISKELTVSAWILKKSTPDVTPIMMKGELPYSTEFLFSLGWRYPVFCYKNTPRQTEFNGIWYKGWFGGSIHYADNAWLVPGGELVESSGYWKNITAVFDKGTVRIYVNGKLTALKQSEKEDYLKPNQSPIYVGAERQSGESLNFRTADMLLNDLRLYNKALSESEVKTIFNHDKVKYDLGNLIPKGKTHLEALEACFAYPVDADFDPQFKRKLNITRAYEKNIPEDPYANRNITAAIKTASDRCSLIVDGEEQYPVALQVLPKDFMTGKYWLPELYACVRDFAAANVNLSGFPLFSDFFWLDEGKYDWERLDALFKGTIQANPQVLMKVKFMLTPPPWFIRKYPDELEKCYYGNNLKTSQDGPLGSEKWLAIKKRMLKDVVSHIESSDYAGHVYGYLPGGGQSAEWYWPGSVSGGISGYSSATQISFRKWLREKYNNDLSQLREAWQNPGLDFATVEVPAPEMRRATEYFLFRDPRRARAVIDFREFMNDYTTMQTWECAKAIKEACKNQKIVTVYSGYCLPQNSLKLFNSGLLNIGLNIRCPYIDCLATPITYTTRRGGQNGANVNPFYASARLHGKLIWQENDLRTHFHTETVSGRTENLAETLTVVKRGFAQSLVNNAGFWWYSFNNAWMHQEDIMEAVAKIKKVADASLSQNRQSIAEVAFIFDEHSLYYLASRQETFLNFHTWQAYLSAFRMGAPFDFYLLDDIGNPHMPDYKLYVFLNTYFVNAKTRAAIEAKVKRSNAVSVWCYAPGFITENGFDSNSMHELTGIKIKEIKEEKTVNMRITDNRNPITKYASNSSNYKIGPIFHVDDPEATVLATVNNAPALAVKNFSNWKSVYSLMPLTKELLTGLCEFAGVHVYTRSFDVFATNKSYMMLHTSSKGNKTIMLPAKYTVKEVLTDKIIGSGISSFSENLPEQATRIYKLSK